MLDLPSLCRVGSARLRFIPGPNPPWSPFGKGGLIINAEGLRLSARPEDGDPGKRQTANSLSPSFLKEGFQGVADANVGAHCDAPV